MLDIALADEFGDHDVVGEGGVPVFLVPCDVAEGEAKFGIEVALRFELEGLFGGFLGGGEVFEAEMGFCAALEENGAKVGAAFEGEEDVDGFESLRVFGEGFGCF